MKAWFFLILVLIVLSCEAGKKKKKGKKPSSGVSKSRFLRGPKKATPAAKPATPAPLKKVNIPIDLKALNTTEKFYEFFKLPRLPQHRNGSGSGGSDISTAVQDDSQWTCRFRPTLIHLNTTAYGNGFYFPSCVMLNRCTGCCSFTSLSCKPVGVHKVKVDYYHIYPELGGYYEEKSMWLEEHDDCACSCTKTPDSCDQLTQYWNPGLCECECKADYQKAKQECESKGNFQYDENKCKCVCKTRGICTSDANLEWSDEDCGCVCKNQSDRCPIGQYRSPGTKCKCVGL